ncbi:MAG TPA: hypothetical protein VHL57_11095 [Flavobacteriales bacterium]|jgi:hypothetical protein|nr:hypothetical protein [Flavobacteriales bacterium]
MDTPKPPTNDNAQQPRLNIVHSAFRGPVSVPPAEPDAPLPARPSVGHRPPARWVYSFAIVPFVLSVALCIIMLLGPASKSMEGALLATRQVLWIILVGAACSVCILAIRLKSGVLRNSPLVNLIQRMARAIANDKASE